MLRNHLYYGLKPFLPPRLRLAMRRWHVRRLLPKVRDIWPINEAAGKKPDGWPGWPEGKQFAVVLTHDVEGQTGLDRVRQLAELEMKYGFRSIFNFIPEGEYRVSKELRDWLTDNGFEVGVHDLYHDGKLYRNREAFRRHAQKINRYLKEWNAVGFRSGFMHHNLDWLHDLDIQYDMSTFDTDPFEPQPDGVNTIFPFWVPRPEARDQQSEVSGPTSDLRPPTSGYVELPYTLPQDHTLFVIGQAGGLKIWQNKLAWIADRGGLMLVNTHPDYCSFSRELTPLGEFPAEYYAQFLGHIRERYGGSYWSNTPHAVARFAFALRPQRPRMTGHRVAMVTHSFYESDNRVMRYAEALAAQGDQVEVFCLKKHVADETHATIAGVRAHRLQLRAGKGERTKADYLWPVLRFLAKSSWRITFNHLKRPYDFIHVHNVPDFMVFAAWLPRLAGVPVILDIHDILPEFYSSKFKASPGSFGMRVLLWMEKASARFASHVIISNHLWLEKYAARTGTRSKCSVFINHVDSQVFKPQPRSRKDGKFVVSFPGGLQWHQGLDIAIRAFQRVVKQLPSAELHIYGDGNMKAELMALARELGLNGSVKFMEEVPIKQVAQVMADSDLGVVPKRADSFGNEAYSTKIMEFMSVGVPVVISRTKIDSYYFNDTVVRFFESGNHEELATAILDLAGHPEQRDRLARNGLAYVAEHNWDTRKREYLQLVDNLIAGKTKATETPKH